MTQVTLLYSRDCPNWPIVDRWLQHLAADGGLQVVHRQVASLAEAEQFGFPGSPTVWVDGADPFPSEAEASLSCRLYTTPEGLRGLPPRDDLEQVVRRAVSP